VNDVAVQNQSGNYWSLGAEWRAVFLLEYGGTYRLMYVEDVVELKGLQGQIPRAEIEHLRGDLKSKYQKITPPEIEKLLRAVFQKKYDLRTATASHNPGKTNIRVNTLAKGSKYLGRVFIVAMLAVELEKIYSSADWRRQLGSSSSGVLGAIGGGALAGAGTGFIAGARSFNPWITAGATIVGGIGGGAIGYELASGIYEHI